MNLPVNIYGSTYLFKKVIPLQLPVVAGLKVVIALLLQVAILKVVLLVAVQ